MAGVVHMCRRVGRVRFVFWRVAGARREAGFWLGRFRSMVSMLLRVVGLVLCVTSWTMCMVVLRHSRLPIPSG